MIVRCANCHTEFSLDDQQIGPEGATVRCSVCGYVFPVEPPPGTVDQPWQIRTVEDLLFTAPDLTTLRTWIDEGRLHPDDQVSRTGRHWLRLGDMPEFSSVFSGFTDLPPVFEEVEDEHPGTLSALEELGPPPSFGGTMPVVQGVDTDILVVDTPEADDGVAVVSKTVAVERSRGDAVPSPVPSSTDTSGPMPFPLAELGVDEDEPPAPEPTPAVDESAVRMRPRPHAPTARVDAIPDVVEDRPAETLRSRPPRPTVRYGAEEVYGSASMLEAVTNQVDAEAEEPAPAAAPAPTSSAPSVERESTEVVSREAAVERPAVAPRKPSGPRTIDEEPQPRRRSRRDSSSDELDVVERRRRRGSSSVEVSDVPPRRRAWPLVAGLGLLAGVAVIFGVPSIRAKVMSAAGELAGGERFDPASLTEIGDAQEAMASLDPIAMGKAEAALQGRIDGGGVPASGVAQMKLVQTELLSTRAIERAIGVAAGLPAQEAGPDDVERATQILGSVVAENVEDREHMPRVRALLRLAQGRPAAEILPLLPEDGSGELRQLVAAAPLWLDAKAPVPDGVIPGLEGLPQRSALSDLALSLAYLRAGDEAKAQERANAVLAKVAGQPTATALAGAAGGATPGADDAGGSSDGGAESGGADDGAKDDGAKDVADTSGETPAADGGGAAEPPKPRPKTESVDSLITKGCNQVESGNAAEGLELLRKAKARRPRDLDMLLCIGQGHAKQGKTGKALQDFESILSTSPNFAPALKQAARAADKLGQTDKAVKYYRKLLSQRPGDPAAIKYVETHG